MIGLNGRYYKLKTIFEKEFKMRRLHCWATFGLLGKVWAIHGNVIFFFSIDLCSEEVNRNSDELVEANVYGRNYSH